MHHVIGYMIRWEVVLSGGEGHPPPLPPIPHTGTTVYAQAGGTHPTGMHSCPLCYLNEVSQQRSQEGISAIKLARTALTLKICNDFFCGIVRDENTCRSLRNQITF